MNSFKEWWKKGRPGFQKIKELGFPKIENGAYSAIQKFGKIGKVITMIALTISSIFYGLFLTNIGSIWGNEFEMIFFVFFLIFLGVSLAVMWCVFLTAKAIVRFCKKRGRDGSILFGVGLKWVFPFFILFMGGYAFWNLFDLHDTGKPQKLFSKNPRWGFVQDTVRRQFGSVHNKPIPVDEELLANPPKDPRFGLIMGLTTLEEAKQILKDRGAEFSIKQKGDTYRMYVTKDPFIEKYIPTFKKAWLQFTYSKRLYKYMVDWEQDDGQVARFLNAALKKKGFKQNSLGNLRKDGSRVYFHIGSVSICFEPLENEWTNGDPHRVRRKIKEGIEGI